MSVTRLRMHFAGADDQPGTERDRSVYVQRLPKCACSLTEQITPERYTNGRLAPRLESAQF
jgi:hypothetical protein